MSTADDSAHRPALADEALHTALRRYVRGKMQPSDVDDVVQATLADALAATTAPTDPQEVRRWVFTIARRRVADHYRARSRERVGDEATPELPAESAPHSARDLLRWAERELPENPEAERTLEWLLREGDGEKLEHIAEEHQVPGANVRQRVTRLRKHFRSRWAIQLAAAAAIVAALVLVIRWARHPAPTIEPERPIAVPTPHDLAQDLRRAALEACDASRWEDCLRGLDEAQQLDPAGDRSDRVQQARQAAADAMKPPAPPPAPPVTSAVPQQKAPPRPTSMSTDLPPPRQRTKESPSKPMQWDSK